MKRNLSGWGVTTAGLLLAVGGGFAMWSGWDMILLERGWSLFIAGAVSLSGGVVTIALGRVIAALAKALEARPVIAAAPVVETAVAAPAAPVTTPSVAATPSPAPILERPVSQEPAFEEPVFEPPIQEKAVQEAPVQPSAADSSPPPVLRQRYGYTRGVPPLRRPEPPPATEMNKPPPTEVDRYTSGDSTYVMMSDGSVEVHGPNGVQRFASLAELTARTTQAR